MSSFLDDNLDREFFGIKLGLDNIRSFLEILNHPEKSFPSIHVAGTNGKGSTSVMIANILRAAGLRVGLFTSPHLESIRERFQINGEMIAEKRLEKLWNRLKALDQGRQHELSFFERVTALAFLYFAEEAVDVAVIEVGLGGRLDATNVLQPAVSVITSIAHDHQRHLGARLKEIAYEKAGIIKPHAPVVSAPQPPSVKQVLRQVAKKQGASLHFVEKPESFSDGTFSIPGFSKIWLPMLGSCQNSNAALSVAAVEQFRYIPRQAYYQGLASSFIPGRMEIVQRRPLVLLDGAHNRAATDQLVSDCRRLFGNRQLHCLFGVMSDKDVGAMLKSLRKLSESDATQSPMLHVTAPEMDRAMPVERLSAEAKKRGWGVRAHRTCRGALSEILEELAPQEALVVTGSLFLIAEAKKYIHRIH